jgi:predicted Fe-Mo cluster-binding NifX family protein
MKIAVPTAEGILCPHFGHCEKFVICDVDMEQKKIINKEECIPPPHDVGVIPRWLNEKSVNLIIAGGMGVKAQQFFQQYGITVVTGASAEHAQKVILDYLNGALVTGANACDH